MAAQTTVVRRPAASRPAEAGHPAAYLPAMSVRVSREHGHCPTRLGILLARSSRTCLREVDGKVGLTSPASGPTGPDCRGESLGGGPLMPVHVLRGAVGLNTITGSTAVAYEKERHT